MQQPNFYRFWLLKFQNYNIVTPNYTQNIMCYDVTKFFMCSMLPKYIPEVSTKAQPQMNLPRLLAF